MSVTHFTEERCVMCGEIIEEGRQVCIRCDRSIAQAEQNLPKTEKTSGDKLRSILFSFFPYHRKG